MRESITNILKTVHQNSFPGNVPQGIKAPYINYRISDTVPSNTKSGASEIDFINLVVDYYAETLYEAQTMAASGREALDYHSDAAITSIVFRSESDDYSFDSRFSMIRQEYTIRLKR